MCSRRLRTPQHPTHRTLCACIQSNVQCAAANSNLKKCSLELGGKSPLIIFDDADLEQAVAVAQAGLFLNSGQVTARVCMLV